MFCQQSTCVPMQCEKYETVSPFSKVSWYEESVDSVGAFQRGLADRPVLVFMLCEDDL